MVSRQLLENLAGVLDGFTMRRLEGAGVAESSRCLEVGATTGTIACWLADRTAEVIAVDTAASRIPPYPGVTVLVHDLATAPLIDSRFDLVHARLALAHLPQWPAVLARLVAALAPGGALVLEEFEASWDRCVMESPDPEAPRLFAAFQRAFVAVLRHSGTDPEWHRQAGLAMRRTGLVDVETEFWARTWHGGESGCLLPYAATGELREQLIDRGMAARDLDQLRALLLDPRLVIRGSLAVSAMGRKPRSSGSTGADIARGAGRPGQPDRRSSSRWNSQAPAAWRHSRPPKG